MLLNWKYYSEHLASRDDPVLSDTTDSASFATCMSAVADLEEDYCVPTTLCKCDRCPVSAGRVSSCQNHKKAQEGCKSMIVI